MDFMRSGANNWVQATPNCAFSLFQSQRPRAPDPARSTVTLLITSLLAVVLMQSTALAGVDTDIPGTNRVTLASGEWKPSEHDTEKALAAVQSFLEKPTSTNAWTLAEIKKILAHTKDYRVQFTGVRLDGKKMIRCNFFPARTEGKEDDFDYWKRQEVAVCDGGFAFWQVYYDPSTAKCTKFMSNGYA